MVDYDLEALKRNIAKLEHDIQMFKEIADKSEVENRWVQAEVFHKAAAKARGEIEELEGYVRRIERGHTV